MIHIVVHMYVMCHYVVGGGYKNTLKLIYNHLDLLHISVSHLNLLLGV